MFSHVAMIGSPLSCPFSPVAAGDNNLVIKILVLLQNAASFSIHRFNYVRNINLMSG